MAHKYINLYKDVEQAHTMANAARKGWLGGGMDDAIRYKRLAYTAMPYAAPLQHAKTGNELPQESWSRWYRSRFTESDPREGDSLVDLEGRWIWEPPTPESFVISAMEKAVKAQTIAERSMVWANRLYCKPISTNYILHWIEITKSFTDMRDAIDEISRYNSYIHPQAMIVFEDKIAYELRRKAIEILNTFRNSKDPYDYEKHFYTEKFWEKAKEELTKEDLQTLYSKSQEWLPSGKEMFYYLMKLEDRLAELDSKKKTSDTQLDSKEIREWQMIKDFLKPIKDGTTTQFHLLKPGRTKMRKQPKSGIEPIPKHENFW